MTQALKLLEFLRTAPVRVVGCMGAGSFWRRFLLFAYFLPSLFLVVTGDAFAAEAEAGAAGAGSGTPSGMGIKRGNITILPMAYMGVTYDSNLYKTETDPDGDLIYLARPAINIIKRMPAATWTGTFSADIEKYNDNSKDDNIDLLAKSELKRKVTARTSFFTDAQIKRDQDPPSDDNEDVPDNLAEPVTSLAIEGTAGIEHRPTRDTTLTLTTGYSYTDYDDVLSNAGTLVDQDFRDEGIFTTNGQIDVVMSRYLSLKTVGDVEVHEIRSKDFLVDRDYTEWKVEQSTILSRSPKLLTELTAGIRKQDFHDDRAQDSGLLKNYGVRAEWMPTQRLTLQLAGIYEDLGVDFEEGISSGYKTEYEFSVNYKLRRDLNLGHTFLFRDSTLGVEKFDEDFFSYNFTAQYNIDKQWDFSLDYLYENQDSERAGKTYDRNAVTASFNWRY